MTAMEYPKLEVIRLRAQEDVRDMAIAAQALTLSERPLERAKQIIRF